MSNSGCILHVISVGFHHRRGSTVEASYPPLFGSTVNGTQEAIELPAKWKHLASLALPDGAHNYLKDSVYFILPSLEKEEQAVYGIASYRQAYSTNFSHSAPQPVRNTVQKSLVVLMRFPLFSLLAHDLSAIAECLFEEGVFTWERLKTVYEELEQRVTAVFSTPTAYQDALACNLSAANFLRVYGRDALVCFKLILLERRVLFDGDSAGWMCNWILTLLSLYPDLLAHGLSQAAFVDQSWITDRACWVWPHPQLPGVVRSETSELGVDPLSPKSVAPDEIASGFDTGSVVLQEGSIVDPTEPLSIKHRTSSVNGKTFEHDVASVESTDPNPIILVASDTSGNRLQPSLSNASLDPNVLQTDIHLDTPALIESLPVPDTPFVTDHWGFPLALFTKSNLVPIYVPLGHLDFLLQWSEENNQSETTLRRGRCVRGFLAGATNPLLRTHKQLADVIITSLSPTDGLNDSCLEHSSTSLTSLFETNLKSLHQSAGSVENVEGKQPTNVSKPSTNQSRGFSLPRRAPPIIRICPTDPASRDARCLPAPLPQALQLTRMDRLFVDELIRTVVLWYQAKMQLLDSTVLSNDTDIGEVLSRDDDVNAVDHYLSGLTPAQKTILMRFPSATILDRWIRQQFQTYLRALLLTADGYSNNATDFNAAYVACLQTTRAFLVWRGQFVPTKVFSVSSPKGLKESDITQKEVQAESLSSSRSKQPNTPARTETSVDPHADYSMLAHVPSQSTPASGSVIALLSQHPGRRYAESDDWEQFVDGFKRFGNLAADRGRRLMSQGMMGLNKLGSDINANLRATASNVAGGGVISKVSDAFKSFLGGSSNEAGTSTDTRTSIS